MEERKQGAAPGPPQLSPRASSVVGMVASVGTNLVLYPLDLIKVKLQGKAHILFLFLPIYIILNK